MKATRYILLVIGLLGLLTAIFGLVNGEAFTEQLITIICGTSLILGYFTINKKDKADC